MFSAWDLHSWITSVGTVPFMISLVTAFSALVAMLTARILGEDRDVAEAASVNRPEKKPQFRDAA